MEPFVRPVQPEVLVSTQPITGTVTVAAFPATQAVTGVFFQATQPVSGTITVGNASLAVTGPLTDTQLRLTAVPVSGTVTVANASLAVTGPLTDAQLRLTAVPVSGSFFQATQPVSGTVSVAAFPASQAVTGAFFQATQPVSIASMPTTPITRADTTASGTTAAVSANVAIALNGQSGVAVQITGTWVGTLQFEGTVDGTTWVAVNGVFAGASAPGPTTTANGVVRVTPSGLAQFRIIATAWTSGTATITLRASAATGGTFLNQSLPVGTNAIGTVSVGSNSLVSTANSTAANLAAAAVFTGPSEDVSEYSNIAVTVFSSHASATDGLSMQQSADGANWDMADAYSIPAATGKIFQLGVAARFYRLVYTNGATLTTSIRIQTLYSKATKRGSSVRPQDGRTNDNDLEETSAYLSYFNGTTWDRARGSAKGVQPTSALGVQDLKDAGRVSFAASTVIAGVTAVTVEALLSIVPVLGGTAGAAATSVAVTAAKRLRIQAIHVSGLTTGAAVLSARISLRMTTTGAVTATSPIIATVGLNGPAAVALTGDSQTIEFPDGFEISGTQQIGFTQVAAAITGTLRASIIGFEY